MTEQAILLLRQQIEKLQVKDFELKAWKKQTALLLMRIFGEKDPKVTQTEQLEYEFNSWSLRDASGNESYEESRRRIGRNILEAAIMELETFGMPDKQKADENVTIGKLVASLLQDELKGGQVKQIRHVLQSDDSMEEKRRQLGDMLDLLDKEQMKNMLSALLLDESFSKIF
ncbi:MAG: hypothetical protein CVT92_12265 [Bacteroidetes bacterium HGW-Bacteroidetes-1]|jgi:hypothetical protein|nr:MAG: hypothetical protein CVT92_12265 [Bacteroidetes bacterium HGW-Bacteroidetes-1]